MARHEEFTHIEPDLRPILEELRSREPIFHTRAFGATRADFEAVPGGADHAPRHNLGT